jgi:hypothetical protein
VFSPPVGYKIIKEDSKNNQNLTIKTLNEENFSSIIKNFKNNLFNDEFSLLSNPATRIQLRSMTVGEYKFLTKQFEIYEKSIESIEKENQKQINENYDRDIDIRESILTNAIDTVLQRCITNNIKFSDLTLFDWIYSIIALKIVSRGSDENLKIFCSNKSCRNPIMIGVMNAINNLRETKDKFMVNPIDIIPIKDDISLYLSVPTRGDFIEAQKIFLSDSESTLGFVNSAMFVRAYIQNNCAYILSPNQRFDLINILPYEILKKIKEAVNLNVGTFYKCFSEIKCDKCNQTTEVDLSDFIMFFYDF